MAPNGKIFAAQGGDKFQSGYIIDQFNWEGEGRGDVCTLPHSCIHTPIQGMHMYVYSTPLPSTPQGQSRHIHIHVEMTDGGSPLQCDHISSVAIGSIHLRTRYEEPLDSWQEQDLDRLRNKWSDALMNRREYFDSEIRKVVSKKGEDGGWGRRREA